jgi:phosphatidylserine/phosphatidylglycerophosphate/cardiolipin synthase-like enzyme
VRSGTWKAIQLPHVCYNRTMSMTSLCSKHLPFALLNTILIASLVLATPACQLTGGEDSNQGRIGLPVASPTPEIPKYWYAVYFSDPADPSSKSFRGGPDKALAEAIDAARVSVDVAVLQLNLWSIRDALLHAYQRGVKVRLVTDSDYLDEKEVQQLAEAGVPVLGDRREELMHNKFTVIDRQEVWTGSMNYTVNEAYRNNNNLIRIYSPQLAENYTTEFEEMFVDDRFGPGSPANTPNPSLKIGETRLQSCFSPDDGCTAQLVKVIRNAKQSIYFLAYSFTSDDLAGALIERFKQGVKIEGVMERSQQASNSGTEYERFRSAGLNVRLDANPNQMHDKVMVIDGQVVVTGSFNYTYSAEKYNDENLLVIYHPQIAELYLAEFERIFNQASK